MEKTDMSLQSPQTAPAIGKEEDTSPANLTSSDVPYATEKPLLVSVEHKQYFVHKSLLAARIPYFRTMFKDCWDGKKKGEVTLDLITSKGFDVVLDWVYSGKLSSHLTDHNNNKEVTHLILHAFKAADVLMIDRLKNELIVNRAACLVVRGSSYRASQLKQLYEFDLSYTKYYAFCLKSVVECMMKRLNDTNLWDDAISCVEDNPQLLADMLRKVREWNIEPWDGFMRKSLDEFLVQDTEE